MLRSVHKTRKLPRGYRIFTMYEKDGKFYAFHVDVSDNLTPTLTTGYKSGTKAEVNADILLKTGENLSF